MFSLLHAVLFLSGYYLILGDLQLENAKYCVGGGGPSIFEKKVRPPFLGGPDNLTVLCAVYYTSAGIT